MLSFCLSRSVSVKNVAPFQRCQVRAAALHRWRRCATGWPKSNFLHHNIHDGRLELHLQVRLITVCAMKYTTDYGVFFRLPYLCHFCVCGAKTLLAYSVNRVEDLTFYISTKFRYDSERGFNN